MIPIDSLSGQQAVHVGNVKVEVFFLVAIKVAHLELCMVINLIELYLFIPVLMTLMLVQIQDHGNTRKDTLKEWVFW